MRLFCREYGSGIPLIALHGLYASSDSWLGLVPALEPLCRLVLVDLRNHGRSPHSPEHSYRAMAADLLTVMDSLSLEKVVLLGHSMGGKVAMQLAFCYPERVEGLVVEDISPLAYTKAEKLVSFHYNILNALQALDLKHLSTRPEAELMLNKAVNDLPLCQFLLKNLYRNANGSFQWRLNVDSILANFENIMEAVNVEGLPTPFVQPTLFIKGEQSTHICANDEVAIAQLFSNHTIRVIPKSTHWPHIEQQSIFLEEIKRYLHLLKK